MVAKVLSVLEKAPQPFEVTGILEMDKSGSYHREVNNLNRKRYC